MGAHIEELKVLCANASRSLVVVQVEVRDGKPWVVVVQPEDGLVSRPRSLGSAVRYLTGTFEPFVGNPTPYLELVRNGRNGPVG